MALLPLRRKARWGFFSPKNLTASAGFEPANLGTRPPKPIFSYNGDRKTKIKPFSAKATQNLQEMLDLNFFFFQQFKESHWFIYNFVQPSQVALANTFVWQKSLKFRVECNNYAVQCFTAKRTKGTNNSYFLIYRHTKPTDTHEKACTERAQ